MFFNHVNQIQTLYKLIQCFNIVLHWSTNHVAESSLWSDIVLIGVESSYQLWRCLHHLKNIKVSSGTHTAWGNAVRAENKRVGGTMPQASKFRVGVGFMVYGLGFGVFRV